MIDDKDVDHLADSIQRSAAAIVEALGLVAESIKLQGTSFLEPPSITDFLNIIDKHKLVPLVPALEGSPMPATPGITTGS